MSILIGENTRVIVQGATGRDGSFHAARMATDGTRVVAGVTPGKGGTQSGELPIYNTVAEAAKEKGADASVLFVPAPYAAAAVEEASNAGIPLIVCITEGIPVLDMISLSRRVRERGQVLIGPNCPGLISPGKCKIGIMPSSIHRPGRIGVISRSGTLTYEVVHALTHAGMGQSTAVGIGGDPIIGTGFIDLLERFEADDGTDAVVLIGEIGGDAEEQAAAFITHSMTKPVVAFISGRSAPPGKKMGHAGAIISGGKGTAVAKVDAFNKAGVPVADTPSSIPSLLAQRLKI
ncbi:MAG: succinate--CoA ligase subunit alpha [Spirochaetales bacterium]|nr:succinate--CoA ligase subunit alpha [Spirochaetales bacterium]